MNKYSHEAFSDLHENTKNMDERYYDPCLDIFRMNCEMLLKLDRDIREGKPDAEERAKRFLSNAVKAAPHGAAIRMFIEAHYIYHQMAIEQVEALQNHGKE